MPGARALVRAPAKAGGGQRFAGVRRRLTGRGRPAALSYRDAVLVPSENAICCCHPDPSPDPNRHFAVLRLGGPNVYLDVLPEGGEEFH